MEIGTERMLSEELSPANINGYLMPFSYTEQPLLVEMPGNPNKWLPIFSSVGALEKHCERIGIKDYKIKKIDDGLDFLYSIKPYGIRVMANPFIFNGNTRWTEILED